MMSLRLEPTSKKTGGDMITPVEVIPLEHQAINTLPRSKSPSNEIKRSEGVERTTDKTGGIHLPTGTDSMSIEISPK